MIAAEVHRSDVDAAVGASAAGECAARLDPVGVWQPIRGADQTSLVPLWEEASDAVLRGGRAAGEEHPGLPLDQRAGAGAGQSRFVRAALRHQSGRAGPGFRQVWPLEAPAVGMAQAEPASWEFPGLREPYSPGPQEPQAWAVPQAEAERRALL